MNLGSSGISHGRCQTCGGIYRMTLAQHLRRRCRGPAGREEMPLATRARALGQKMLARGWLEQGGAAMLLSHMREMIPQRRRPSHDQRSSSDGAVAWRTWAPDWAVVLGAYSRRKTGRSLVNPSSAAREFLRQRKELLAAAALDEELRAALMGAYLIGGHEAAWAMYVGARCKERTHAG